MTIKVIIRFVLFSIFLLLASSVTSLAQNSEIFVTAFLTGDGTSSLKLVSWDLAADGSVNRLDEFTAGAARYVALTRMGTTNMLATAIIDASGNLKIITWQVLRNGTISRLSDVTLTEVAQLDLVSYGNDRLVVAMRDNERNLRIITWSVANSGALTRLGTGTAGEISMVRVQRIANSSLFVTAVRDGAGNLKLISWDIDSASGAVSRRGDASGGAILNVSIESYLAVPSMSFLTIIQNSSNFKIIYWMIASDGTITRLSDYTGGEATAISSFLGGGGRYFTATRNVDGNLDINAWRIDLSNNNSISNWGGASAGAISQVAANACGDGIVTVITDSNGNLKLIRWRDVPNNDFSQIAMNRLGDASGGSLSRLAENGVCMD